MNIDSLGRRVTPQASPSEPARDLYLFGGSTAWGFTARDSGTIGAYMARALADRGVKDVRVVNLAQAAFNTTQENVTLLLSLTQHERPAAAVFLDGYNDVTTGWKYREPGHTFGDDEIPIRIRLGARGFWGELFGLGRHAEIVQSLRGRLIGDDSTSKPSGPAPCGAIAEYYRSMATSADALAAANGFVAVHFLQPVPATGGKVRTEWEKRLPPQRPLGPCMTSIDSAMADRKGTTFVNLKSVFDSVQGSVFIDNVHITEDGNRLVAEQIANFMAPLLSAPPKPSSPAFKQR